jgi:hypothetical protein
MFAFPKFLTAAGIAATATLASTSALACGSCGCSLNADWGTQGLGSQAGWSFDARVDYLNQNQLRKGTGVISSTAAATLPNTAQGGLAEVEQYTRTLTTTATLDYNQGDSWGVSVSLPTIARSHGTLGVGSDGSTFNPTLGAYFSQTSGLGDMRVMGRYYGFADAKNWGVQFGLKLPTGRTSQLANDGLTPVDAGLQLGTGTTDAIVGAYIFDNLSQNWSYFAQTQYQSTFKSSVINNGSYRPGNSLNVNAGVRYEGFESFTPTLQINTRFVQADSGAAADTFSTGGKLMYLSPGVVIPVTSAASIHTNVQLPIYQNLNGIQLSPRYILSAGIHVLF